MTQRPIAPPDFPIDSPSTEEGKAAAKLHTAWVQQYARVDKVERDYNAAQEGLRQADQELQDALAEAERQGKPGKAVSDAEAAYAAAKEAAEGPWQQRATAAAQAAEERRAEYETYVDAHLEELLAELADEAEAASDAIHKAAQALDEAFDRYQRSRRANEILIGPAQAITGQALPQLGAVSVGRRAVESLVREKVAPPTPSRRHLDERRIALGQEPVAVYGKPVNA